MRLNFSQITLNLFFSYRCIRRSSICKIKTCWRPSLLRQRHVCMCNVCVYKKKAKKVGNISNHHLNGVVHCTFVVQELRYKQKFIFYFHIFIPVDDYSCSLAACCSCCWEFLEKNWSLTKSNHWFVGWSAKS